MVCYSIGKNNEYVYPESVAGVVWKSTVYHYKERVMVGETDEKVTAEGKKVIALKPDQAKKVIKEYKASYPKPKELTEIFPSSTRPQDGHRKSGARQTRSKR